MRNKYSKEFEETMIKLAPTTTLNELLQYTYSYFGYEITKSQLRQYLYKRNIKCKDYNTKKARPMGDKLPIGSERVRSDGMVRIKTAKNKWELKQRYIYEKHHNVKLTNNDFIIFLNQDRTDFNINNLMRVTRHESSILANQKMFSKIPEVTKTGIQNAKLIIKLKSTNLSK